MLEWERCNFKFVSIHLGQCPISLPRKMLRRIFIYVVLLQPLKKIRKPLGFLFSRGTEHWGEMGSTILGQWPIVGYPEIVENLQVNIIDFHPINYKRCYKQYIKNETELPVRSLKKLKLNLGIHLSSIVTCHVHNHVFI